VGGSVIIGIIGIGLGISLTKLEIIESQRGNLVSWMLIAFGLIYSLYGVNKYLKKGSHFHLPHFLVPKKVRNMAHFSEKETDDNAESMTKITPWILFLIFIFGPCEVLIPLLIFPAAQFNTLGIVAVSLVFGSTTILTMLLAVYLGQKGTAFVKFKNGEKYFHIIAGIVILISGIGIQFLGW
jgi:sulfite exporter TauE/SafE